MRIIDTVVLIAFRDRNDSHFKKASEHVIDIGPSQDILAPSATLVEFDLELKSHGESDESRAGIYSTVARLANTSEQSAAAESRRSPTGRRTVQDSDLERVSYLDTLIAATGLEFAADEAITTDRKFSKLGIKPVF